jgi:ABC-type transport system substrate-binding protein
LAVLDPIWTTAYMSRNHGYMIYDTLFGTDENGKVKPQMVESWTESPDKRLWTFKLRKGLEFHDGKPVTGEDVIASLQRWGKRDAMGSALAQFVLRMDSPTPDTFRIFLGEANGFMIEALGKPSSSVPFIMPKRIAETEFRAESLAIAQQLQGHAQAKGVTLAQFATAWVLANQAVSSVIAGPRTLAQWESYLPALDCPITADDEGLIDSLVAPGHPSTPGFTDPAYPLVGRRTGAR